MFKLTVPDLYYLSTLDEGQVFALLLFTCVGQLTMFKRENRSRIWMEILCGSTTSRVFYAANARYKSAFEKVLKDNESKDPRSQSTPKIRGAKFFVDCEIVADLVSVPTPKDLLTNSNLDIELLDNIRMDASKPDTLLDSMCKVFAIEIENFGQANIAYKKIKLENLFAIHVIMACAFKQQNGSVASFSCDDREDMAGVLLEWLMKEENFLGYALIVAKWKLGGNMGQ